MTVLPNVPYPFLQFQRRRLVGELELLQLKLERPLVLLGLGLPGAVLLVLQLQRELRGLLQLPDIVLVLVQQVLHLLLVHLDLRLIQGQAQAQAQGQG